MLLEVKNLSIKFDEKEVIQDVSFNINKGECLAILGHNGSGKTSIALAILNLLEAKVEGEINLKGKNLRDDKIARELRKKEIRIILQEVELNPTIKVGKQILDAADNLKKEDIYKLLEKVNLDKDVYNKMSHELSGGMRQRVNIAIALSCNPSLIIADEACSNLDKASEENIIQILKEIKTTTSLLYISHDIDSIKTIADRILVIKEGEIVESGDISILSNAKHEYTKALIRHKEAIKNKDLEFITSGVFNA